MNTVAKQVAHGVIEISANPSFRAEEAPSFAPAPATMHAVSKDIPPPPVVQNPTGDIEPEADSVETK